jgi:hypothetical protein
MLNSGITGRLLHRKIFRNVSSLSHRITTAGIKERLLRWIGHVICMWGARNSERKDNLEDLGPAGRIILK